MSPNRISALLLLVGLLAAAPNTSAQSTTGERIVVILDCSGSMASLLNGQLRLDIARNVLTGFFSDLDDRERDIGLVTYGHKGGNCDDLELLVAPGRLNTARIAEQMKALRPLGKTPLAMAIKLAGDELLKGGDVPMRLVILTDGMETCGGDPLDVIKDLKLAGVELQTQIVGFAVKAEDRAALEEIATAGGGKLHLAHDAASLKRSFQGVRKAIDKLQFVQPPAPPAPKKRSTDVLFEETFDGNELSDKWRLIAPNNDTWLVEDGALTLVSEPAVRVTDGADSGSVIFPNTIELLAELPKNFTIEVEADISITASEGAPYATKEFCLAAVQLWQDDQRWMQLDYHLAAGGNIYYMKSSFIQASRRSTGKTGGAGTAVDLTNFKGQAPPATRCKVLFRIDRKGSSYTASIKRLSGTQSDRRMIEVGRGSALRMKPRLRINCGLLKAGQTPVEMQIRRVTIKSM